MNCKSNFKIIKFLEENIHDLGLSKVFLDGTPKARSIKEVGKLEFIKIEYLCPATNYLEKRKTIKEWEKIFANQMSNKESTYIQKI